MNVQKLTQRQIDRIISDAYDDIIELRRKVQKTTRRLDKNLLYTQIDNRKSIIKRAESLTAKISQS